MKDTCVDCNKVHVPCVREAPDKPCKRYLFSFLSHKPTLKIPIVCLIYFLGGKKKKMDRSISRIDLGSFRTPNFF